MDLGMVLHASGRNAKRIRRAIQIVLSLALLRWLEQRMVSALMWWRYRWGKRHTQANLFGCA